MNSRRPLLAIEDLTRDAMGDVTQAKDPAGRITHTKYDARRRAVEITDGAGNTVRHQYDLANNKTHTQLANPVAEYLYRYDARNRLAGITGPIGGASLIHDVSGNLSQRIDANGNRTGYAYDARNRRIGITYADGASETTGYDGGGAVTAHTDANGNAFSHDLDARGRRIATNVTPVAGNLAGSLTKITYAYDGNGNTTRVTQTDAQGTRHETTAYDAFDRPTQVTDAYGNRLEHSYDPAGNRLVSLAQPGGAVTRYTYDALDRLVEQTGTSGQSQFHYDPSSLLTGLDTPDGASLRYAYDGARRLTQETHRLASGGLTRHVEHTYDGHGNRTQTDLGEALGADEQTPALKTALGRRLPEGASLAGNGRYTRGRTETYAYDKEDRLVEHRTPERKATWSLDAAGRRLKQTITALAVAGGLGLAPGLEAATHPGGLDYTYDERDRLVQISADTAAQAAPGGHPAKTTFSHDANGNRTGKTETWTAPAPQNPSQARHSAYTWNAQDQLVGVAEGADPYSLQPLATYRYGANRLRTEKALTPQGRAKAAQNSPGLPPAQAVPALERSQWDDDHARRRYSLDSGQQRLLADLDAAPGDSAAGLAGAAPRLLGQTDYANPDTGRTTTQTRGLHADAQGSIVATVLQDPHGARVDSLSTYTAYGGLDIDAGVNSPGAVAGASTASDAPAFASYFGDPETGLYYARARYYDPATGQYLGRDPVDGEIDTPITWAAYLYARGNPYRYTDPSGQCTFDDSAKKCATEIAGGAVGAIGLTTVQAVEGAIDTAKAGASLLADLGRGAMGDPGAQQRNRARLAQAGEVVHTLGAVAKDPGKALTAMKRAASEIDNEARRVEQAGDVFTAAMLRGNYAGKIGLAAATLPKALREVSDLLVDAGKKAAEEGKEQARRLAARDPVSRANTPTRPTETARATVEIPETASLSVREGLAGLRHEIMPKAERRVLAESSAETESLADLIAKGIKPFAANDLVYGPSASGKLAALTNNAGGRLLSDMLKARGKDVYMDFDGDWKKASQWAMNQQLSAGGVIRFDLTHVDDLSGVLSGSARPSATTSFELRYLNSNWERFQSNVIFYRDGRVIKPW